MGQRRSVLSISSMSLEDLSVTSSSGNGSVCEEVDEGLATSYNAPRSSSITEFDKQKHQNARQLLSSELAKLTSAVADDAFRQVRGGAPVH